MKTGRLLEELKAAAGRLGLEVRVEKGNFEGGRCVLDGEELVMLNKRHLPERRLAVLARCLREEPLEQVYLKPAVRKALKELWAEQDAAEQDAAEQDAAETLADG